MKYSQLFAIKLEKKRELVEKFNIPESSGIYIFKRKVENGEQDSKGAMKTWTDEMYIGQAKHLLDRCASHYMPFSHNHLAISLSKYDNWQIIFRRIDEKDLNWCEKATICQHAGNSSIKLLNNSSGGQGSERGKHLENSDFKQKVEQKKNSVEERAKRKLEKHLKKLDTWKKYFIVNTNQEKGMILIQVKEDCFTKKRLIKATAVKAFQKLLKYLGE